MIVVDADAVADSPGVVSLDLTILAGDAKGEMVSLRADGITADPVMLLGLPGTLAVADGIPHVTLEP